MLLEAMAAGVPVICLDVGGPSVLVAQGCGFKIPVLSPTQVIDDIFEALCVLAGNPHLRESMSQRASHLAEQVWNWDAVGGRMLELYENFSTKGV